MLNRRRQHQSSRQKPASKDGSIRPSDKSLPEWVPLPSGKQTEYYSGLKRGVLNRLILATRANNYRPPVRSVSLKGVGQIKGKRLVALRSLLGYLRKLQTKQSRKNLS